jgi:hypothetical protein
MISFAILAVLAADPCVTAPVIRHAAAASSPSVAKKLGIVRRHYHHKDTCLPPVGFDLPEATLTDIDVPLPELPMSEIPDAAPEPLEPIEPAPEPLEPIEPAPEPLWLPPYAPPGPSGALFSARAVPEPSTLALVASGLLLLIAKRRTHHTGAKS